MRILVVDDESSVRTLLRRILEGAGHEVFEAHDGAMALGELVACGAELVMTDMMMPVMRGNELIAKLRADPVTAAIPIVVVSSEAGIESLPADAALTKPFSPEAVLIAVGAVAGGAD
jgi:CheY-like chemotaxis protein